jgi:hypothetical protein
MAGVMDNIGGAMSMASTGLVVLGAAVPLKILQNMANSRKTVTTKRKRRKKTKRSKK